MKHLILGLWTVLCLCGCYKIVRPLEGDTDAGLKGKDTNTSGDGDSDMDSDSDWDMNGNGGDDGDWDRETDSDMGQVADTGTDRDTDTGVDTARDSDPYSDVCAEWEFDVSRYLEEWGRCLFEIDPEVFYDFAQVNIFCDGEVIPLDKDCSRGVGWDWVDSIRFRLCTEPCGRLRSGAFDKVSVVQGCGGPPIL